MAKLNVLRSLFRGESADELLTRQRYLLPSKFAPLAITHKKLAKQWHPTKNGPWTPYQFTRGSHVEVWWRCPKGADHVFKSAIKKRTRSKSETMACPFCHNRKPSITNSLYSLFPKLAKEWHAHKNGKLKPTDIVAKSSRLVWWQCPVSADHEWRAKVSNRTVNGSGCPACDGKMVSSTNSLAALHPKIASQWHPRRNGKLTPDDVVAGSGQLVWWRCSKASDHVWQSPVSERTASRGTGCPFCAGRRASVSNSLYAHARKVAQEWHPTLNGTLTPKQITYGSDEVVWWKCRVNPEHDWQDTVTHRTSGRGCPFCAGKRVDRSNSLLEARPDLAKDWHPKNDISPDQVTRSSGKRFWWRCSVNASHEWEQTVNARASGNGRGCPFCAGKKASPDNCLATLYPAVAAQWHPTKNGKLLPSQVTSGSAKKVWWQCSLRKKHVWKTSVSERTSHKTNCPMCHIESLRTK